MKDDYGTCEWKVVFVLTKDSSTLLSWLRLIELNNGTISIQENDQFTLIYIYMLYQLLYVQEFSIGTKIYRM